MAREITYICRKQFVRGEHSLYIKLSIVTDDLNKIKHKLGLVEDDSKDYNMTNEEIEKELESLLVQKHESHKR